MRTSAIRNVTLTPPPFPPPPPVPLHIHPVSFLSYSCHSKRGTRPFQAFTTLGFICLNVGYVLVILLVYVAPCKGNADLAFWNAINSFFGSECSSSSSPPVIIVIVIIIIIITTTIIVVVVAVVVVAIVVNITIITMLIKHKKRGG